MLDEYIEIGPGPSDEDIAQIGDEDYTERNIDECNRFIKLIRETVGPEPVGARLKARSFSHDFGYYREVICCFDGSIPEAVEYAFKCEREAPARWTP